MASELRSCCRIRCVMPRARKQCFRRQFALLSAKIAQKILIEVCRGLFTILEPFYIRLCSLVIQSSVYLDSGVLLALSRTDVVCQTLQNCLWLCDEYFTGQRREETAQLGRRSYSNRRDCGREGALLFRKAEIVKSLVRERCCCFQQENCCVGLRFI